MGNKDVAVGEACKDNAKRVLTRPLNKWESDRARRAVETEWDERLLRGLGIDHKMGLYGTTSVLIVAGRRPEKAGLGDDESGMCPVNPDWHGDSDWLVDWPKENTMGLGARLVEVMGEGYRVCLEDEETGRWGIERLEDGKRVASVETLAVWADKYREVRQTLGQNIEGLSDWEVVVGRSMVTNWGAVVYKDGVAAEVVEMSGRQAELVEINPDNLMTYDVYCRLMEFNSGMADSVPGDYLAWMGRLGTLTGEDWGFMLGPEAWEQVREDLNKYVVATDGFRDERYRGIRHSLAVRMGKAVALGWNKARMSWQRSGLLGVFSPTMSNMLEGVWNGDGEGSQVRFTNFCQWLEVFERTIGDKSRDVNCFLAAVAYGLEMNREEWERAVTELSQSWGERRKVKGNHAAWGGRVLGEVGVDTDRLKNWGRFLGERNGDLDMRSKVLSYDEIEVEVRRAVGVLELDNDTN